MKKFLLFTLIAACAIFEVGLASASIPDRGDKVVANGGCIIYWNTKDPSSYACQNDGCGGGLGSDCFLSAVTNPLSGATSYTCTCPPGDDPGTEFKCNGTVKWVPGPIPPLGAWETSCADNGCNTAGGTCGFGSSGPWSFCKCQ